MNWLSFFQRGSADPIVASTHPSLGEGGYWSEDYQGDRVVIFSGAGLSAESGLATFRGDDGLWENHKVDEVCNGHTWRDHRDLVERFYQARLDSNRQSLPHDGHRWCAEMEARGAVLITQNVDTMLEKAGAKHVVHLHGKIDQRQCFGCGGSWNVALSHRSCPYCKSEDTRVDVVFFKEQAPRYQEASNTLGALREKDVLVVVGTEASVVNPLRWLTRPCHVIIVDPNPSSRLATWPRAQVFASPASSLRQTLAPLFK